MIIASVFRIAAMVCVLLFITRTAASQTMSVEGQLSTWFILNDERPSTPGIGVRYLPTLSLARPLAADRVIDAEVALNAYGFGQSPGWHDLDTTGRVKPYRLWARFKTSRFEGRVGLQKINFGSAVLLRPLRWFDSVDPRDPLQITDGVYGLLVREYFPGNYTGWLWGLYGNDQLKGLELSPTRLRTPEYGGRFQTPLFKGELAFTTHHRRADLSKGVASYDPADDPLARESRYALDGKWDIGIGIWFEGAVVHQTRPLSPAGNAGALTLGADYTFGLGNGLHVLGEYFVQEIDRTILGQRSTTQFTAASVSYPLGLLDNLSGILYVDAERERVYQFVNWQRTYDRWQLYFMGFWNPRQVMIFSQSTSSAGPSSLTGRGFQIMAVYNHGAGKDRSARTEHNEGAVR
jgi:hypothetical protein